MCGGISEKARFSCKPFASACIIEPTDGLFVSRLKPGRSLTERKDGGWQRRGGHVSVFLGLPCGG